MRIVFMGTPDFASRSLERLYDDGHEVAAIFTQPDKRKGRGMKILMSPVKELALKYDTPVYQPASLRDAEVLKTFRELNCELIAVVAYGRLLTSEVLSIPYLGCVNIHGSLLPKYRGAAPVHWAVLNGETLTGVTSMLMTEELDAGDILLTRQTEIGEDETSGELYERLSILGADLLSETIKAAADFEIIRRQQNHNEATYAPAIKKDLSPIDWTKTAYEIKCKIRGLSPWPGAVTDLQGVTIKVFSAATSDVKTGKKTGEIIAANERGIEIACADGSVIIRELQPSGGRIMNAADYLRGRPLCL